MKKYILIICYAFSWVTPAIALNESGNKEITVKEACKNLGITIDKFYREKKRINKEK